MRRAALALVLLAACADEAPEITDEAQAETAALVVQDRFTVRESRVGHAETLDRLLEGIDRRDLTVFAVIDHRAGAQAAGLDLPASTLVIFGSPQVGTPLIRTVPILGAELPLRALVAEDATGRVTLALTGIDNLERSYPLRAEADLLGRMRETMDDLAYEATR